MRQDANITWLIFDIVQRSTAEKLTGLLPETTIQHLHQVAKEARKSL